MTEHDPRQNKPIPPEAAPPSNEPAAEPEPAPEPTGTETVGAETAGEQPEESASEPSADASDKAASPTDAKPLLRNRLMPGIAIAIVVLALLTIGEVWLFRVQSGIGDQGTQVANLTDQVDTLRGKVSALESKVTDLANRPVPQPTEPAPAPAPAPAIPPDLANRIAAMQASIASLSTTTLADHATIATLQQQGADLPKLVARAQTLAAVAQGSLDLQNGQPLGTIPNAPEALARYATAKPPTLAGLKASFAGYASAASRAGGDTAPHGGFWQSVKGRVEGLITVRRKDKVLVGSDTDGILSDARAALDGDDLAGALTALKKLPPAAAAAMQPWSDKAGNLLAARAALAKMAEQD